MSDNFSIDLTAELGDDGLVTLRQAIEIVFRHNAPGGKATHWVEIQIDDAPTEWMGASSNRPALILLWSQESLQKGACQPLPVALRADGAFEMVRRWLEEADPGPMPDLDGDAGNGFRIFTNHWGHAGGFHYAVLGVSPAWALYGK